MTQWSALLKAPAGGKPVVAHDLPALPRRARAAAAAAAADAAAAAESPADATVLGEEPGSASKRTTT